MCSVSSLCAMCATHSFSLPLVEHKCVCLPNKLIDHTSTSSLCGGLRRTLPHSDPMCRLLVGIQCLSQSSVGRDGDFQSLWSEFKCWQQWQSTGKAEHEWSDACLCSTAQRIAGSAPCGQHCCGIYRVLLWMKNECTMSYHNVGLLFSDEEARSHCWGPSSEQTSWLGNYQLVDVYIYIVVKSYIHGIVHPFIMFVSQATGPPSTVQISWAPGESHLNSHVSGEPPGPGQEHGHQWWDTASGEGYMCRPQYSCQ